MTNITIDDDDIFFGALGDSMLAAAEPRKRRARRYELLDDNLVQSMRSEGGKDRYVFDKQCPYLAVRLRDQLATYYFYPSTLSTGGPKKHAIGPSELLTTEKARQTARVHHEAYFGSACDEMKPRLHALAFGDAFSRYKRRVDFTSAGKRFQRLVHEVFLPTIEHRPVSSLTRRELSLAIDSLAAREPGQANLLQKQLKTFLNWCIDQNIIDGNPLARRAAPSNRSRRWSFLPATQVALIYYAARELPAPWKTMVGLLVLTGARVSDIRSLTHEGVDLGSGTFACGSHTRRAWLPHYVLSDLALEILNEAAASEGLLFPSPRKNTRGAIELRPSILMDLHAMTETAGWSWYDLTRSVRSHLRSVESSLISGIDPSPIERERAKLNTWANALSEHRDRAIEMRANEQECALVL